MYDTFTEALAAIKGYARMTEIVRGWAARHASGRLVSLLEGGYNLDALARSVEAHLKVLWAGLLAGHHLAGLDQLDQDGPDAV